MTVDQIYSGGILSVSDVKILVVVFPYGRLMHGILA